MAAPTTIEDMLGLLERSSLVPMRRVQAVIENARQRGRVIHTAADLAHLLVEANLITPFHAEQLLAGRHKGFLVGRYKILRLLGSGGMGRVYLAEHTIMHRKVALKVLPKTKSADPAALGRFHREARAVAALSHPNIVHAYDTDSERDLHYMVMEYVQGLSIQDYIKKLGPIPWPLACDFVCQTADGLQHAFEHGLVHRDIKPGNLLVDCNGIVKILDYGLAFFYQGEMNDSFLAGEREKASLTLMYDENVLGTADYLAPEQAIDSHGVDVRADIYSLGCTFYFMLIGHPPYPNGTIAQKLLWHQSMPPVPVRELNPTVPPEVAAILDRMLAKKPQDRFQEPREVAETLAAFAEPNRQPFHGYDIDELTDAYGSGSKSSNKKRAATTAGQPTAEPPRGQGSRQSPTATSGLPRATPSPQGQTASSAAVIIDNPFAAPNYGVSDSTRANAAASEQTRPLSSPQLPFDAPLGGPGIAAHTGAPAAPTPPGYQSGSDDRTPFLAEDEPTAIPGVSHVGRPPVQADFEPIDEPDLGSTQAWEPTPPLGMGSISVPPSRPGGPATPTAAVPILTPEDAQPGAARLPILYVGIAAAVVLLLASAGGVYFFLSGTTPPAKQPVIPKPIPVAKPTYDRNVITLGVKGNPLSGPRAHEYFEDALTYAESRDRVLILDAGPWTVFPFEFGGSVFEQTSLTLEGRTPETTLRINKAGTHNGLVRVINGREIEFANLILDGNKLKGPLVVISGGKATFRNVTFRNIEGDVCLLTGPNSSASFERCTWTGITGADAAAIAVRADGVEAHVVVRDCVFTGVRHSKIDPKAKAAIDCPDCK